MIKANDEVVCVTGKYKNVRDFGLYKVKTSYNGMITLIGHGNRVYRAKDFFKWEGK